MTSYRLVFRKRARREWEKLGETVRRQFRKKLGERLRHPHVPGDRLSHPPHCYRIKLRKAGYRLIYRVVDDRILVIVVAVGQRERGEVYEELDERLAEEE